MAERNKPINDQLARFKAAARALECDEDKEKFESQLGKIAAHKPPKDSPPKDSSALKAPPKRRMKKNS